MNAQVLVVDDEPVIRDVLAAWLGHEGYECSAVGGVSEALDRVAEGPFDVALLDVMLPDGDGVSLARRLREADDDLELIMATGMRRFDVAVESMRLNVMDYLVKPFTRQQLIATVDRAVRRRQVTRHERTDRAQLEAQIAPRAQEIARSLNQAAREATLDALLTALRTRNPEAATHAHRVARMAVTLGMQLGLAEAELRVLQYGALLHDIGKIAMPDSLMCRPGPLTKEEMAVIRTHPEVGYNIISVVPSLQRSADIVLASHEAWDGSGYPFQLAGTDIPLGARITAVTDTFDALTWSRVYREPASQVGAAAELVRCAGTQFDPDIVHSWLRVLDIGHPTVQ